MSGTRIREPAEGPGVVEVDSVDVYVDGENRRRQRIVVAPSTTRVARGEAMGVAPGQTAPIVTMVGEPGLAVVGITATGDGDGLFQLLVDDVMVAGGRINWASPTLSLALPAAVRVDVGSVIQIDVRAYGSGVADYEATVYGEVTSG